MNKQRGFGLVEVLIALVVISVGLLGIASLQAASISRAHISNVQSLAAIQAQNIVARMLANPEALPPNSAYAEYETTSAKAEAAAATSCDSVVCKPAEMAQYDLHQWGRRLKDILPQGDGKVACDSDPLRCTVTIKWQEKRMDPASDNSGGTLKPRQYSIVVLL